jgi:hypothetical protein
MVEALEEPEASDLSPQCPLREIGASLSTKCVASRAQLVFFKNDADPDSP